MIIEELELANIRSYSQVLIRLPLGKTLFEGDIGSGKSTILMAIEFALFGLGSEPGASILKLGEKNGQVRMLFEVEGREYEVRRGLERKAGRVQQTEGSLRTPEETLNLSPSELKERILDVLEFNEAPDPKAQSWIYRYAVYTPQEEMKGILSLRADLRLQILRRAFRVEDYKIAAENADEIGRAIRGDVRELDGIAAGIDGLEAEVESLAKEEQELRSAVAALEGEATESEERIRALKLEREKLQREEVALERVKGEKQMLETSARDLEQDAADTEEEVSHLKDEAERIAEEIRASVRRQPTRRLSVDELKERERGLEEKVKRLTALMAATESKLADYQSIMKKGVCPVCDRPVKAHDFTAKKAAKEAEREHVSEELAASEAALEKTRKSRESAEAYRSEREKVSGQRSELLRIKAEIKKKGLAGKRLDGRIQVARARLDEIGKEMAGLDELAARIRKTDTDIRATEEAHRGTRDRLSRSKEKLEGVVKRRGEVGGEIDAKKKADAKRGALKERDLWLASYFVPTVQLVERSVLASLNQDFDSLLQKWFAMLVSDPEKDVRVDDEFTPIVSQGGYEQDVQYLSGGERTSVALAYRLALNTLAQRTSAAMKSNLLILDEPTDGFSKEQLGNVREVLDDVGCSQVIIVSHDNELESFADQVFRVSKTQGESRLEAGVP